MKKILALMISFLSAATIVMAQSATLHVTNYTTRDGLGSNVVNCGLQDRQGYIWLGTNYGLTRFDGHRFANFYVEAGGQRQIEGITHIVEDTTHNELLMSGKDYRLLCFDLGEMRFVNAEGKVFPKNSNDETVEHIFMNRARELGIDRGNKTNRRHDLHYAKLDDGREIFATIDNGFFIYEPANGHLQQYRSTDERPIIESDYINGILKDRSNGVWLFTTFAGIYRLDMGDDALKKHALAPNIRSMAQIDDQHIAVADMEGRVYSYNPDTRESSMIFNEGIRAYALNADDKGRLWIGTRGGGVWIMDGRKRKIENLPARQIYDIVFSPGGTTWFATLDGGLIEGHEQSDGSFLFFPWLLEEKIHELAIDRYGRLWIAAESGVWVMDGDETHHVFDRSKVVCICCDPKGIVWAGSNGYGLLKIDNDSISYVQANDGLANNCVESVVYDKEGNVIVGTDQGVSIISSTDRAEWRSASSRLICKNFYSQQGLRANTYNENAILCTTNGRVFLGNLTGLVELLPEAIGMSGDKTNGIRPLLTSIDVNEVTRYDHLTDKIVLSHHQNNLCFNFSSFAYHDLESVIYSYKFDGIDNDWRPSTKENRALFTNLRPGHYCLHVRSRLAGTKWSEETLCEVYIAQPWYWTWWARLFYLLIIVLFIWYEWHQYQQRLSLRQQLDQRLTALYAVEMQREHAIQEENKLEENEPEERELDETAQQKAANQRNKDFLDRLDNLILQNLLQTDLDVNYIAQEMCVSYSTLHRRIKSLTGITANEYVRKHRLTKAMQLLRDGHNASEVAMQCGFNSPSYFTRCFKAEYGILPSEV